MDISIEPAEDGLALKLATDGWEVNVYAAADDLLRLRDIRTADWSQRRSIRAGTSAGGQAFWASTDGAAALMIGSDDDTWDITITIPFEVIDLVVEETESLKAPPPG